MLTQWVKRLLIANTAVFVATLALPVLVGYLAFVPAEVLWRPWTVLTYMFVHGGFFHLLFNMLGLFFFGPVLEERWGSREFIKFYLICGLGGALLSVLFPHQAIVGASAAVYGVMVAFALYWPESPIYIYGIFPVKAKWLVGFLVGMSLFFAVSGGGRSGVAHLAHLGGALAAFTYLKSSFAPSAWGDTYQSPARKKKRGGFFSGRRLFSGRRRLTAAEPEEARPAAAPPRVRASDDVDRILDKISSQGIAALTAEERRQLEEASRRHRTN